MAAPVIVIPLSYERPPITTNRPIRNVHARQRVIKAIQDEIGWRINAHPMTDRLIDYPVHIRLVWTVPDNRVRDSSGPDPVLKAAQDGLVKFGLLKDDRHEMVTHSYCVIEKGDKYAMRLEIEAA
jgi:Holliday junction resolvase RusA-like endonuclease